MDDCMSINYRVFHYKSKDFRLRKVPARRCLVSLVCRKGRLIAAVIGMRLQKPRPRMTAGLVCQPYMLN